MNSENPKEVMPPEVDDEEIRKWFESRDPNRKKPNPFIDEEAAEKYGGKTKPASTSESNTDSKPDAPTFADHDRHVREVARHFFFVGAVAALSVAIGLVLLL